MCYQCGSPEQATNPCPMCKVFVHPKCPHRREICRNRITHPRFDVLFLTNAEGILIFFGVIAILSQLLVESFNGCGYCKWARHNNLNKEPLHENPGWPGCCRAPKPSEYRYISVVDWASVSVIYDIPIPPEIKATLDSFNALSPTSLLSTNKSRRGTGKGANRRSSANTMHPEKAIASGGSGGSGSGHTSRTNSFSKEKGNERVRSGSGGSPRQIAVALTNLSLSRSASSSPRSQSSVIPTLAEHHQNHHQVHKRPPIPDFSSDKRSEGTHSAQSSPTRKNAQLENVTADTNANALNRVPSVKRHTTPGISGILPSPTSAAFPKIVDGSTKQQDGSSKRRSTVPAATAPLVIATSGSGSITVTTSPAPDVPQLSRRKQEDEALGSGSKVSTTNTRNSNTSPSTRSPLKLPSLPNVQQHLPSSPSTRSVPSPSPPIPASPPSPHSSNSSDSGSSDSGSGSGSGSISDCTIISEGFTDYLSEESEAELQRQAEERAARVALVAQTQAEEMEFRAARMKLASVDLRPPKAWVGDVQGTIGNNGGSGNGSSVGGVNVKTPSGSTRVKTSPTHVHGAAGNPSASLGRTFASRQSVSGARV